MKNQQNLKKDIQIKLSDFSEIRTKKLSSYILNLLLSLAAFS